MKKNSKKRIALYAIVAVVIIAALYYINNPITGNAISTSTKRVQFSRGANPDYYSLLLPKPADFDQIKLMFERGIIRDDPDRINESYWEQPEWFPRYAESFVPSLEETYNEGREPIWGIGIFDSQIVRSINKDWLENPVIPNTTGRGIVEIKNNSVVIKHRFWLRAVPGAIKHFGVRIYTSYPTYAHLLGNAFWGIAEQNITQDTNVTEKYIKIWTDGPDTFTLGNYWPKIEPDYIKEIQVETEISKDTPKGMYVVEVDAGSPSKDYQQEQSLKYGLTYTDPNIGMFTSTPSFKLFVEVI